MFSFLLPPSFAFADGGTLRLTRREGGVRVSVFTSPTPLRAGPVDVSVLVQEADTGKVVLGLPVTVRLFPADNPGEEVEAEATAQLATNKLLQAAHLELSRPGRWALSVTVTTASGPVEVAGEVEVSEGLPSWRPLAPWVGWPFAVVALFLLGRLFRALTARSAPPRAPSPARPAARPALVAPRAPPADARTHSRR